MTATALADTILFAHALIVAFVIFSLPLTLIGGWLGWAWVRRPGFRFLHLGLIGFIVAQTWLGELCPLTIWENDLRGASGPGESFIAHWLRTLIYVDVPLSILAVVYTAFAALVALSFWWVPVRFGVQTRGIGHKVHGA
mgnify:CR=1 FL=1